MKSKMKEGAPVERYQAMVPFAIRIRTMAPRIAANQPNPNIERHPLYATYA